ncbi:MAG TPA: LLM class flavin-dependent oxidoreductase [Acidimicrobiales bacterium]|nr:LLM class flavin-dependent oxidoreductase [Acidimicrobiales bacterium]
MTGVEFGIYLPQAAWRIEDFFGRAFECERLGYDSFWLFDHLYTPGQPTVPSYEGWTLASTLLARTTRLRVGHLVLCNNFRHPALVAKMVSTLDVVSGGRVELGIGSGSVEQEHLEAGFAWGTSRERGERLGEALEIITRMLGEPVTTFEGRHYAVHGLPNLPPPVQSPRPPIHVGGAGPTLTLPLVARYADVWNVPTYALGRIEELSRRLDAECERIDRDPATLRRSVEAVLAMAPADQLESALSLARRRYGAPGYGLEDGGFTGTPVQVTDRVGELIEEGFSSFVLITHDRASTETLQLFAEEVMAHFPRLRRES